MHRTGTNNTRCEVSHLYCCSADKHSPTYNVHIVEYMGREVISKYIYHKPRGVTVNLLQLPEHDTWVISPDGVDLISI